MWDSRKLDEPSPAPGRCRIRGNPKTHRKARLKVEEPGKPGDSTAGGAEGCGIRGNSMNHRRKSRKMQDSGRPEDCIERRGRTVENAGKPGDLQPAAPKDADSRKLEEPIAGTAWRPRRRGNSQPGQTRLNGTMHGPMPCEYTLLRRQRLRSLASSFVAGLRRATYIRMRWRTGFCSLMHFS
jgi:hypothetical protein